MTHLPGRLRPAPRGLAALTVFTLVLAGCQLLPGLAPADRLSADLSAAERRWADLEIRSYRFRIEYHCFCWSTLPIGQPIEIVVVDGDVVSVKTADGKDLPPDQPSSRTTIEDVLGQVRGRLGGTGTIEVVYDPATGIPVKFASDPFPDSIDDEFSFEITDFVAG